MTATKRARATQAIRRAIDRMPGVSIRDRCERIAAECGVGRTTVESWRRGNLPRADRIALLARATGATPAALLGCPATGRPGSAAAWSAPTLRTYRAIAGCTQADAAARVGMVRARWTAIESGRVLPAGATIPRLALAVGAPIDALFGMARG